MATIFTYSIPASCVGLFRDAGWMPGRNFTCRSEDVNYSPAAQAGIQLLAEFGGLSVGKCGPGQEYATSDIQFATSDASIDFNLLMGVEQLAGENLYPIGSVHRVLGELFINACGLVYMYGIPDGSLYLVGESFEDALERLLLGRRLLREIGTV
jgi:hypothetical protein